MARALTLRLALTGGVETMQLDQSDGAFRSAVQSCDAIWRSADLKRQANPATASNEVPESASDMAPSETESAADQALSSEIEITENTGDTEGTGATE